MPWRTPAFSRLSGFGPLPRLFEEANGRPALRRLFANSEIPFDGLHPRTPISFAAMNEVFNSAARLSGDPLFTLRVSRAMAPEDYGPWAEFALAAPTLRNAIHRISGLATLQTNSMKFGISDDGHQVFWSFEYPQARGLFVEHHALHVLIPLVGAIRRYAGVAAHPSAIHLPLPRTLALRRVEEAIEVPVVAGADAFGIMFPSQWLAFARADQTKPVSYADMVAYYRKHRLPRTVTDAVAALLNPIVGEVDADLDLISQRLAMSRRSLQQVLNSEGASFRDILLGVRIGRAKDLIADGTHALSEVALSVGYSDQAHFTRAFKTATGSTPKEFQQSIFAPGRARGSDDLNGGASAP